MVVVAYVFIALAFLRLREKEPEMMRPFHVPAEKLVGLLALTMSVMLGCLYLPFGPSALVWPYEWAVVIFGALFGLISYIWALWEKAVFCGSASSTQFAKKYSFHVFKLHSPDNAR